MIPTAEVPVTNYHSDEILSEEDLPFIILLLLVFVPKQDHMEKDTHGLIRQHQFHKVELVKITTPEQSDAEHEKLTADARRLLEKLK